MEGQIDEGVLKIIEVMGVSKEGFDDAVQQAVRRTTQKVNNVRGLEVLKLSAKVNDANISEFHANVKIAFVVNE